MASRSAARPDVAGRVRLFLRLAGLLAALLGALPLHFVWRVFRLKSPWPRLFLALGARIIGVRLRILGRPLRRDVVFLSNHLSWIDIPVLAGFTGCTFVAKSDLRDTPLIGQLCALNHTLFVQRDDRLGVREQIEAIRAAFAQDWVVTIFPEGTTGDGITLRPFKAPLLAAFDPPPPGVVVQPVRIDYGADTPEIVWLDDETGQDHAVRILKRAAGFKAIVRFLEPFDPREFGGRKAVAAEARRRIEAANA